MPSNSSTAVATPAAAPAATVIGTMNRRQCSQAATPAPAAHAAIRRARSASVRWASVSATSAATISVSNTPPTNVSSSRMLGSAIRRRRVKYSARPQLAAATTAAPSALSTCAPSQPTATRISAAAMVTKMSLKPVSRRKCSSSAPGVACSRATKSRNAAAEGAVSTPAFTAASSSASLYIADRSRQCSRCAI